MAYTVIQRTMADANFILWSLAGGYAIASALLFFFPQLLHKKKSLPFTPRHISHRGGAGEHLENTMSAFKHAVAVGTDMLETDCQLTKDGFVVVAHENCLKRLTGKDAKISETNYGDLPPMKTELALDSDFGVVHVTPGNGDTRFILLRELFEEFPRMPINIDVKVNSEELLRKVSDLIVEFKREDITVWGNRTATITEKCYATNPRVPIIFSEKRLFVIALSFFTGLLPFVPLKEHCFEIPIPRFLTRDKNQPKCTFVERMQRFFGLMLCDVLFMNRLLMFHLKRRGIHIYFWVINTEEEYNVACYYNPTGIMTDFPSMFLNNS